MNACMCIMSKVCVRLTHKGACIVSFLIAHGNQNPECVHKQLNTGWTSLYFHFIGKDEDNRVWIWTFEFEQPCPQVKNRTLLNKRPVANVLITVLDPYQTQYVWPCQFLSYAANVESDNTYIYCRSWDLIYKSQRLEVLWRVLHRYYGVNDCVYRLARLCCIISISCTSRTYKAQLIATHLCGHIVVFPLIGWPQLQLTS